MVAAAAVVCLPTLGWGAVVFSGNTIADFGASVNSVELVNTGPVIPFPMGGTNAGWYVESLFFEYDVATDVASFGTRTLSVASAAACAG
jgi:hypothetical protein